MIRSRNKEIDQFMHTTCSCVVMLQVLERCMEIPERTRMDRNGQECTKMDRNGHRNGPKRTGMDTGIDQKGPEWTPEWT